MVVAMIRAERFLREHGWNTVNPAAMDLEVGIDPSEDMKEYDYSAAAGRDIKALLNCDAIYLMAGWQHSMGACWEREIAVHFNIRRYYEIPREDHS